MVAFLRKKSAVARHKVGRRGAVLLLIGLMYVILGMAFVVPGLDFTSSSTYAFPAELAPLPMWGGAYIAVGVVSSVTAFWPTGRDAWGYALITGFTLVWGVFGFISTFMFDSSRGWVIGTVWLTFAAVVMIVSGMKGVNDE